MPQQFLPRFNVSVGDRVRSYDWSSRDDCYMEGPVENIVFHEGYERYQIAVEARVWHGVNEKIHNARSHVYPPVNGTPTIFGEHTFFVEKLHVLPTAEEIENGKRQ
jgi:hypothetical protein